MKQIKALKALVIILIFSAITVPVYATANFSTDKSEVEVGEEFSFNLEIDEVAAWNIHIEATGAVEDGCELNEADVTEDALNTNKTFTQTCKAKSAGDITISLKGDYTTEDGVTEELSGALKVVVSQNEESKDTDDEGKSDSDNDDKSIDISDNESTNDSPESSAPDTGFFTKEDGTLAVSNIIYLIGVIGILTGGICLGYTKRKNKKS